MPQKAKAKATAIASMQWASYYNIHTNTVDLLGIAHGDKQVLGNVEWEDVDEFGDEHVPTMKLSKSAATALINSLWDAGIRPDADKVKPKDTVAMEKHLEDMRKIAFSFIKLTE